MELDTVARPAPPYRHGQGNGRSRPAAGCTEGSGTGREAMKGYEPNLLEKLLDEDPRSNATSGVSRTVSLEQYKDSVVRDLEGLLNSRAAFSEARLEAFPQCRRSMMTYGLEDFSGKSLANAHDRAGICRSLEQAIARHEPRLTSVRVSLHSTARIQR